jgi:DNA polymerase III epsilon subunit-like protein
MNKYELYCLDTESTGLDPIKNDIIELSIYRLSTDEQKTWLIKPTNISNIDVGALRVNKHKLEDITHQTKYGKDTYADANKVIVEVENWLSEDNLPSENRVMLAQNTRFDYNMLEQLWTKCNSIDSFPFGRRYLDTMQIEFFFDVCMGQFAEGYSLANIIKKYGISNIKAHTAASDTLATKQVFEKQIEFMRKLLKNG